MISFYPVTRVVLCLFPMASFGSASLWVKFKNYSARQVSTENCDNVNAITKLCMHKFPNKLGW